MGSGDVDALVVENNEKAAVPGPRRGPPRADPVCVLERQHRLRPHRGAAGPRRPRHRRQARARGPRLRAGAQVVRDSAVPVRGGLHPETPRVSIARSRGRLTRPLANSACEGDRPRHGPVPGSTWCAGLSVGVRSLERQPTRREHLIANRGDRRRWTSHHAPVPGIGLPRG